MFMRIFSKEFKYFTIFLNFFVEREINIGIKLHLSTYHYNLNLNLILITIVIGGSIHYVIDYDGNFKTVRHMEKNKLFAMQYTNNPKSEE